MKNFRKTSIATGLMIASIVAGSAMAAQPTAQPHRGPIMRTVSDTLALRQKMAALKAMGVTTASTDPTRTLAFGGGNGGTDGVGVMSGQAKVYLVFYGNQWGTSSTDANGYTTFSNDAAGAGVTAQKMFKGIGTNGELWQAELTQWCDGAGVPRLATSCPSTGAVNRIPYQQNILAGVWYDNSIASPAQATGTDLANEAIKAAQHFGNTTAASNRYAYYVILSPTGTNPDDYKGVGGQGYCAWHDHVNSYVTSTIGDMAFSNQPYNLDGSNCGKNFVNAGAAGTLDGYTMTLGHEWQEMMSDQFPNGRSNASTIGQDGGWTNHITSSSWFRYENSDECAWISPSSTGGAANVAFSTGTFAQQASWSNDTDSCAISHPIVGGTTNTAPVANFSFTTSALTATFTDSSTDAQNNITSRSWNFGDGVTSTLTNPSHTYAAAGTYSVTETVTDAGGLSSSKTLSVTVSAGGGGGGPIALTKGVAVTNLSAALNGYVYYKLDVPAGATNLTFTTSGGTGDADMYVKFGSAPTDSVYDCRPFVGGNAETCSFAAPSAGTYYVTLKAFSAFSGVSLVGDYTAGGGGGTCGGSVLCNGVAVSLPSTALNTWSPIYTINVPAGKTSVVFNLSGGTGDADLYVRRGSAPTTASYDCRPYLGGNTETCTFNSPTAGTYYVGAYAYAAFSGASLKATISP